MTSVQKFKKVTHNILNRTNTNLSEQEQKNRIKNIYYSTIKMIATQTPSTIQLSQHQQVFFFNGNTHNRDLPVSLRSQSIHMLGRRRDRIGCCSTRSRHHHLNHATILIQEHRHRLLVLRRQYNNSNTNDSNSRASLEMIIEEEEEDQLMKEYNDYDDDDTITTTNTTLSSSSSSSPSSSSASTSSSSLSSSFSPPSTIPILSGTDFYWQSQRKSLSSLAYYY